MERITIISLQRTTKNSTQNHRKTFLSLRFPVYTASSMTLLLPFPSLTSHSLQTTGKATDSRQLTRMLHAKGVCIANNRQENRLSKASSPTN